MEFLSPSSQRAETQENPSPNIYLFTTSYDLGRRVLLGWKKLDTIIYRYEHCQKTELVPQIIMCLFQGSSSSLEATFVTMPYCIRMHIFILKTVEELLRIVKKSHFEDLMV